MALGVVREAPLHGGDIMRAVARWGLDPAAILDFSANINPFGTPPDALAAAQAALAGIRHYPEPFARPLRQALASRHRVPEEAVLVGNGASEVIHLLGRLAAGRRVAVPVPGFAEYARAARGVGAEPVPVDPSCARLPSLANGDLLFLCNPHNPTGSLLSPAQVLKVARETQALLVVDEAFIDLTDAGEQGSVAPWVTQVPNLIVLRSLTKFYGMPGLRVGYALAPTWVVSTLDGTRDPWSVSGPAQAGALAALKDLDFARRTREWIRSERPFLAAGLAQLPGYEVMPPSANFILVEAPEPAHVIQERLGPRGILVRDCRSFPGLTPYHMRLAVRTRAENLRLLEALQP